MLLDEIFESVKRIRKVWMRSDGDLRLVKREISSTNELSPSDKPLFPISKPRYPDRPNQ